MIADKMRILVQKSSIIRAMFEEGKRMSLEYGEENVFDFSLGNPSVEPPYEINKAVDEIIKSENKTFLHGYMSNNGYDDVRETIANHINNGYSTELNKENIIMTVGAAGGLNVILKTLINPKDEVIVFAPFFGEYSNYIDNYDGVQVVVSPNKIDFQPNIEEFETRISDKTKVVIINTPNNPTGVIYSENSILKIVDILKNKSEEYGHAIYLVSDEPYRELVYNDEKLPFITNYYNNTIVCYSYSKSLSLPGERIGYLVIPSNMDNYKDVYEGACVANRILGFVNAPSLMQRVIMKCVDVKVDTDIYNKNRIFIYDNLKKLGYECVEPKGAFYLFIKSPIEDDKKFAEIAKKYGILIVPGTAFGCSGYCRLSYCIEYNKIVKSINKFKEMAIQFGIYEEK